MPGLSTLAYCGAYLLAAALAYHAPLPAPLRLLALAWVAVVEPLFFVFGHFRLAALGRRCGELPATEGLETVWARFMELQQVFGIEEFLQGWFLGADPATIKRGNLQDFVAYAFFNQTLEDLSQRDRQRVDAFLTGVEAAWGVTFEEGYTPGIKYMGWLWEDLRVYHKPLAMYCATEAAARLARGLLWAMGFRRGQQGLFSYWLHRPLVGGKPRSLQKSVAAAAEELWGLNAKEAEATPAAGERGGLRPRPRPGAGAGGLLSPRAAALGMLWRRSITAGEGAVHHVTEHAVDAAVTVASTAAAAVAAQHPHSGQHHPHPRSGPLSPGSAARAPSDPLPLARAAAAAIAQLPPRPPSAAAALPVPAPAPPAAGASAFAAEDSAAEGGPERGTCASIAEGVVRRRRRLGDSAASISFECPAAASPAAASAAGLGAGAATPGGPASSGAAGSGAGVPIVFLHGVGFGTLPYLHFVRDMMRACSTSPVIVLEVRHVALRLCWEASAVDDVAHAVAALLRERGFSQACMTGHSYGTFVISRLCQLYPGLVHSACLMDPVCMMTCYPQLLHNFIYKSADLANLLSSPLAVIDLARYICSRDLTISQAFCRKFNWVELMLWPHELPARSVVVLSGGDDLVPAELVMAQLKLRAHPAKVMFNPDLGHGGVLIAPQWQAEVVAAIRELVMGPPPAAKA